jgi:hypothetical protein
MMPMLSATPSVGDLALLVDPHEVDGDHREGLAGGGHTGDEAALAGVAVGGPDGGLVAGGDHVVDLGGHAGEAAKKMRQDSMAPARAVIRAGGRRNPPAASDDAGAAVP